MKLFALGRTDLAAARKFRLVGKAEKFTEKAIIMLRILSYVGDRDPLRATSALTSSTGGVVAGHRGCLHRRWDLFSLGRYGRLQRVQNRCCSLLICFLFQIVVSCYRYLQCLFAFHFLTTVFATVSLFWFVITQPPTPKF